MINPALQPSDLFQRYQVVLSADIAAVEPARGTVTLAVTAVYKGSFAPRRVTVTASGDARKRLATIAEAGSVAAGGKTVAFVGRMRRGREKDVLLYLGTLSGGVGPAFRAGTIETPDRWTWTGDPAAETDASGKPASTLGGAWNGSPERFQMLMRDIAAGTAFFPRRAYARFRPDVTVDELDAPVRGVAIYDIDGDGDADLLAASPDGCRAYLQMEPLLFVDATKHLGLEGAKGVSVSFADADADGRADLLVDATLWKNEGERFSRTDRLPTHPQRVVSAGFAEIDGDGYPDIVVSTAGDGLRVYRNPGAAGGAFVAREVPLDSAAGGGFWTWGDADGDGRADLFFAGGEGRLLRNAAAGFEARPLGTALPLLSGPERAPALTGAGVFAPLLTADRLDLAVPNESGWSLLTPGAQPPLDWTGYANEISDGSFQHLSTVAEDLNADGYVDLFTTSRGRSNFLHLNRGYGSFMNAAAHRYADRLFDGLAYERGAWGAAAGDVDGDGATDLLIGDEQGRLTLLLNDSLALRKPVEHPTDEWRRLLAIRLLTVRVTGNRGVYGARVLLSDAAGNVVARRDIGANVGVGCRGPDTVDLAVREPGRYTLQVRYSDGKEQTWPVDLSGEKRVVLEARRTP